MQDYVLRESRHSPRFKNRAIIVSGGSEVTRIPVPDTVILCDACNAEIQTEQVNLLVVNGGVWGAICEGCRLKHHSELPINPKPTCKKCGTELKEVGFYGTPKKTEKTYICPKCGA